MTRVGEIIVVAWAMLSGSPVHGQCPDLRVVDLTIDEDAVVNHGKRLQWSDGQLASLHQILRDYRAEICEIDRAAYSAMLDSGAGRLTAGDGRDGSTTREQFIERVQAYEAIRPVLDVIQRRALSEADDAMLRCVGEIRAVASLDDSAVASLLQVVYRSHYFKRGPDHSAGDFHARIDLVRLVDEAGEEGGELHAIRCGPVDARLAEANQAIDAIVAGYEARLSTHVMSLLAEKRRRDDRPVMRFTSLQDPEWRRFSTREASRWKSRTDVFVVPHRQIGDVLLATLGPQAKQRWDVRFYREFCPSHFAAYWVESLDRWVGGQAGATPETCEAVAALVNDYRSAKPELVVRAVEAGMLAHATAVCAMGDEPSCRAYWRGVLTLYEAGVDLICGIAGRLPPALRAQLGATVDRQGSLAACGPPAAGAAMIDIGLNHDFESLRQRLANTVATFQKGEERK